MAFWGIEVKPGKPYTHKYDTERGRLRISQATLGNAKSDSGKKSTLQCNVGNKSPVLLCNLLPEKSETCHLELEFEETEEVVFSVVGTRSVHLSGYYLGGGSCGHHHFDGDETDSYGEDIGESDDSGSFSDYDEEDDDEYESDFIDDDEDMGMYLLSPKQKSGVVIEEIIDDEKPSNGNANRRRLKKNQVSDSDDGSDGSDGKMVVRHNKSMVIESEDEDGFPVIFGSKQKQVVRDSEGKSTSKTGITNDDRKRKINEITEDGRSKSEASQPSDALPPSEISQELSAKKKKKDAKQEAKVTDTDGKSKKKKKKAKEGKIIEGVDVSVEKTKAEIVKDTNEGATGDKVNEGPPVSGEEKKANHSEVNSSVPSANTQETSGKLKKKNKKKKAKVEKGPDSEGDEAANVNQTNAKKNSEGVEAANVSQTDSKKKKKQKENSDKDAATTKESGGKGKSETKAGPKIRTYSNGLIVEEVTMGKPDGKRATPGKKVFVTYTGKLKNGKIFDSNVGRRPFGFRLGVGQVIKGWDVGVKGMRVGDKRRLIIPPSYGYEDKRMGEIPPNSWLTFDVELVSA